MLVGLVSSSAIGTEREGFVSQRGSLAHSENRTAAAGYTCYWYGLAVTGGTLTIGLSGYDDGSS
jgi:hypothetical protein